MNTLEQRLRQELPQLADALVDTTPREALPDDRAPAASPASSWRPGRRRSSRMLVTAIAAGCVLVLVGGLVAVSQFGGPDGSRLAGPSRPTPDGFGSWQPLPEAPIGPRPYAVAAWTGSEAVFWAGSSLSRGFAYTDGAAFDPATNSWRMLTVPGWGHPGLTSVYFDGDLYALAKGGGTRFDPVDGTWVDLPQVENMYLAATVATDDAVWGLGPTSVNPTGQPDMTLARYEPETDTWDYDSVFEGTDDTAEIISGLGRLETQVVWTGEEMLAWNGSHGGIAFNPASGQWRTVAAPHTPSGAVSDGVLVVIDAGLALVAEIDRSAGQSTWGVAVHAGDEWNWQDSRIPIAAPETLTAVAAGDWIVLFSELDNPVTIHAPSGAWKEHDDGGLGGVTAPNTAWTGEQLIIWGGVLDESAQDANQDTNQDKNVASGAIWTPPEA